MPLYHPPWNEILNECHCEVRISIFSYQIVSQSNLNLYTLARKLLGAINYNRAISVEATVLFLKWEG